MLLGPCAPPAVCLGPFSPSSECNRDAYQIPSVSLWRCLPCAPVCSARSVDGYRGMVERHLEVEVSGLSRSGEPIHFTASGWKARILQVPGPGGLGFGFLRQCLGSMVLGMHVAETGVSLCTTLLVLPWT